MLGIYFLFSSPAGFCVCAQSKPVLSVVHAIFCCLATLSWDKLPSANVVEYPYIKVEKMKSDKQDLMSDPLSSRGGAVSVAYLAPTPGVLHARRTTALRRGNRQTEVAFSRHHHTYS